ncbi:hypothetical protein D9756_008614 [Leucocoprinus leucothites]|uniref:Uncharacterized protein n=1 Tax=Leucocoprinus leucothites TaxID=201217 RepID=A0A8H5CYR4_9AGAR|nr:hypothetical protein D9756_008614 [Leucoagaricus leucothites]
MTLDGLRRTIVRLFARSHLNYTLHLTTVPPLRTYTYKTMQTIRKSIPVLIHDFIRVLLFKGPITPPTNNPQHIPPTPHTLLPSHPRHFGDADKLEKGYKQTRGRWCMWWEVKVVKLSDILWVTAFNTSFFLGYFTLLDILFYPQPDPTPTNTNLKSLLAQHHPY